MRPNIEPSPFVAQDPVITDSKASQHSKIVVSPKDTVTNSILQKDAPETPAATSIPVSFVQEITLHGSAVNHPLSLRIQNNHQMLPTPVRVKQLSHWLQGYDNNKFQYLVKGFSHGFHLGFQGELDKNLPSNLNSATFSYLRSHRQK